jgi:Tfp pilus assembly protein PilF
MKPFITWCAALFIPVFPLCASTSVNPDLSVQAQDPCRADVAKFERAIGFARQTQGNQAAAELKERLLPAKVENEILFKDGYCGLARHLKEKKLI